MATSVEPSVHTSGEVRFRVGHDLVHEFFEFLAGRARPMSRSWAPAIMAFMIHAEPAEG